MSGHYVVHPFSPQYNQLIEQFHEMMDLKRQDIKPWWFGLDKDKVEQRRLELQMELDNANKRLDDELGEGRLI